MKTLFHFYKNKPEWIHKCWNAFRSLSREQKIFLLIAFGYFCLLILAVITSYKDVKTKDLVALQTKRSDVILRELDNIHSVLHTVEGNPLNSQEQVVALQALEKAILSTQKSVLNVAKTSDIQTIAGQITSVKDDIDAQMNDIKKTLSAGMVEKPALDEKVLPFHVISVDVIAYEPYVSIVLFITLKHPPIIT